MNSELVGYAAAFMTTGAFVPQAVKTIRSRDTRAISLAMYVLVVAGTACWLAYGLLIGAWPVIVANAISFALTATILAMKLRYG